MTLWNFQHLFCHNCVKASAHDCTRSLAVWPGKSAACASAPLCSCSLLFATETVQSVKSNFIISSGYFKYMNRRNDDICSGSLTLWTSVSHSTYTTQSPPWISFPPHFVNSAWSNALLCRSSRLAIFIWCSHLPDPRPGAIPSRLDCARTWPIMRLSGIKLPLIVPQLCWWRFSAGWLAFTSACS